MVVHYLDLTSVLGSIQANGAAYGLPNGVVCAPTQANVLSGCAGYLFYVDGLHLSSDGFRVVAQYIQRQTQAPLNLGATSDLALDNALHFGRTLNSRMDLGSPRDGEVLEGARVFVVGDSFSRDVNVSSVTDAFDINRSALPPGSNSVLAAMAWSALPAESPAPRHASATRPPGSRATAGRAGSMPPMRSAPSSFRATPAMAAQTTSSAARR